MIRATTGTLTLDPAGAGSLANTGTIEAIAGGTIVLTGNSASGFNNAGGTTSANGGDVVLVNAASVTGGTLTSTGTSVVAVDNGQDGFFSDLTNSGAMSGRDNSDLGIDGTITNNGTITITSAGNATDLEVQDSATLAGTGAVVLAGASNNARINGTGTLTIGASQTGRGRGQVGANAIGVVNGGLIVSDVAGGTLTLDPSVLNFDNNGTLRSTAGVLALNGNAGGLFDSAGAVIEATAAGAEVQFDNAAAVVGGIVRGTGGGVVRVNNGQDAFFDGVAFSGAIAVNDNADLFIDNTIANDGTITLITAGNATDLEVQDSAALTGTGTLALVGASGNARILGSGVLSVGAQQTIRGQGQIGVSQIGVAGASNITNGVGATLRGEGTLSVANAVTNAGLLSPGDGDPAAGPDAGLLTILGNLALQSTSKLKIEVGGGSTGVSFDDVSAQNVTLGGLLTLTLFNGYVPSGANTFTVVDSVGVNTLTGAFTNVTNGQRLTTTDGLGSFQVNYGSGSAFNTGDVVLSNFQLIPEPASLAAIGLATVVVRRRRRAVARA